MDQGVFQICGSIRFASHIPSHMREVRQGSIKNVKNDVASGLKTVEGIILKHPLITWWLVACASMMLYLLNGKIATFDILCHADRLNQLSEGLWVHEPEERRLWGQSYVCGNTAVNSPFAYLFAIVPWSIARDMQATCLVNGIATAGLCAVAMALAGKWRWAIMAVCSMPVTLVSLAWMGADAMSIAAAMLLLGVIFGVIDEDSWTSKHTGAATIILIADSLLLGQLKSNLCLLAGLTLMLPLLARGRWGWWRSLAACFAQAASTLAWMILAHGITPVYCEDAASCSYYDHGYEDRWAQFAADPFGAMRSLVVTLFGWVMDSRRIGTEWSLVTGVWTGGNELALPPLMGVIGLLPVLTVAFLHMIGWFDHVDGDIAGGSKILLAVWSAAFVALTAFMVLMVYAPCVYGGQIIGLQGRYFVYMIPVVLMALPRLRWVRIDPPVPDDEKGLLEADPAGRSHTAVGSRGASPRVQAVLLGLSLAASATIGVAGLIA